MIRHSHHVEETNPGIAIVIRSVGERTTSISTNIAETQLGVGEIRTVREDTHEKAIAGTYQEGADCEAEWVLAMDADVLLLRSGLEALRVRLAECSPDTAVMYPGVFDKLYRMKRWAGLQVYRRNRISEISSVFEEVRRRGTLKVEGHTIAEFRRRGGNVMFSREVFGIHDFWQYFRDLYRKAYLNTLRNPGYNKQAFQLWARWGIDDPDYRVLRAAMFDALSEQRQLTNSVLDFPRDDLDQRVSLLGLEEKPQLVMSSNLLSEIENAIPQEITRRGRRRIREDFFEKRTVRQTLSRIAKYSLGLVGLRKRGMSA